MKWVVAVGGSTGYWKPEDSLPYEEALRAAGIQPLVINPPESLPEIPTDMSGVLLMGGVDVDPALYNEPRHAETGEPDKARDHLECALIEQAIARDIPILAICRGIQILNVQHGGTLIQHLDGTDVHRQRDPERRALPAHDVEIVPGTLLAAIEGDPLRLGVNSRHHQAVRLLGGGLRVSARAADDGTIEAIERPDKRFVLGVQWHPENQAATDPRHAKLFEAFAGAL